MGGGGGGERGMEVGEEGCTRGSFAYSLTRRAFVECLHRIRLWRDLKVARSLAGNAHSRASIAFRHLRPNSARFSYATEGTLSISALLSTDAVSALRKVRVLI